MQVANQTRSKYLPFGVVLVLLVAFISSDLLATNGYFRHGYGSKYRAMAGAGSAMYMSPMGVATNPAGLAFLGRQVIFGGSIFNPNREYTVSGTPTVSPFTFPLMPGTVESDSKTFIIPYAGVSLTAPGGHSFGLAIYGNGGMNTDYPTVTFDNPQLNLEPPTGVDLSQLFVNLTYARELAPGHAIGLSGIFVYQRFQIEGVGAFAGFSGDPSKLTNNDYSNSTGFGFRVGYMGKLLPVLTVGASYQSRMAMSEFEEYAGLFAENGDFDIPASINAGFAVKASPLLTLAFDVQHIFYGDIKSIANPFDLQNNPPFVPDPNNPGNFIPNQNFIPLGQENGYGFGWDDMTIFKFGAQVKPMPGLSFRAGYSFGSQPIPDSEVFFNILAPGVIEQHITFGFSKTVAPKVTLVGAFMHAFSNTVTGANPMDPAETIELKMNQFEGDLGLQITL